MNPDPKFCSVCAKKLRSASKTLGFDPFTGKPQTVAMLVCPERGDELRHEHDRWESNPAHHDGAWEQWDG